VIGESGAEPKAGLKAWVNNDLRQSGKILFLLALAPN
jgi:hypothetical protein